MIFFGSASHLYAASWPSIPLLLGQESRNTKAWDPMIRFSGWVFCWGFPHFIHWEYSKKIGLLGLLIYWTSIELIDWDWLGSIGIHCGKNHDQDFVKWIVHQDSLNCGSRSSMLTQSLRKNSLLLIFSAWTMMHSRGSTANQYCEVELWLPWPCHFANVEPCRANLMQLASESQTSNLPIMPW